MTKLNIMASRHSAFYSPMICTIAGGFLEKEGLSGEYHVVEAGDSSGGAVAEGRMDVAQAAVSASWGPLDQGARPTFAHFAQINRYDGFFIAAREPDSDFSWSKLLTGKFLYVHGGQPEAMLRYGAFKQGLDLSDVMQGVSPRRTNSHGNGLTPLILRRSPGPRPIFSRIWQRVRSHPPLVFTSVSERGQVVLPSRRTCTRRPLMCLSIQILLVPAMHMATW